MPPSYVIGLDLGQVSDPTALVVVECREDGQYRVVHLERLPLNTSYVAMPQRIDTIVDRLCELWWEAWETERQGRQAPVTGEMTPFGAEITVVIDQTGVGRAVGDIFRAANLNPLAVTITSGDGTTWVSAQEVRVGKVTLVSTVQSLLQQGRIKAASQLPEWPVLQRELHGFKARISLSGHVSFAADTADEPWRTGGHDDLVLSLALAVWYAEHGRNRIKPLSAAMLAAWGF